MVQNSDWGPHLWWLLHTAAESIGRREGLPRTMEQDERQGWVLLLKAVGAVMPCALCRGHYREWQKRRPVERFLETRGDELRLAARRWVWDLHEKVNDQREVDVAGRMALEEVETAYSRPAPGEFSKKVVFLANLFQAAAQERLIDGEAVRQFRAKAELFRRHAGLA
jgi:hypothetical protein